MKSTFQVVLDNQIVEFKEKRTPNLRRLSMRLLGGNLFQLNIPPGITDDQTMSFVEQNKLWLLKNVQSDEALKLSHKARLQFLGSPSVELYLDSDLHKKFHFEQDILFLKQLEKSCVVEFYKEQAKKFFKLRLDYYTQLSRLEYNEFRIKDTKTRFGSCSSMKNINLNWRLILLPQSLIDYVVWHEVCHLRYMDHSKNFWNLVESQMPDYKYRQAQVRKMQGFITTYI